MGLLIWIIDRVPYLGFRWVFCDRHGKMVSKETQWECRVFCAAWKHYAVVLWRGRVYPVEDLDCN